MPKACLSLPSALTITKMRVFSGVCSSSTVCRLTTLDVIWSSVKPACLSSSTARSALVCSLKTRHSDITTCHQVSGGGGGSLTTRPSMPNECVSSPP
jgi:hypothetical protein